MQHRDVIIIGAGAAGLMCAIEAGKRGRSVVVLDHAKKPAEKIRISGGGRCNFTNLHTSPKNFLSQNNAFCVSALSRYTQHDFIALIKKHGIAFHEKTLGQLFCDGSSMQIITMLLSECDAAQVNIALETSITRISKQDTYFRVETSAGVWQCQSLVVACGGLSIPKMGATGLGYDIAHQFNVSVVPTYPALVPFTLMPEELHWVQGLSGISVEAIMRSGKQQFKEGMLFTHRGISGPAALQISSYWKDSHPLTITMQPDKDIAALLLHAKSAQPKQELSTALCQQLPKRVVHVFLEKYWPQDAAKRLADIADKKLHAIAGTFSAWEITPNGTEGYRTAEVTLGGVDTRALSSKTMECTAIPGLYFIGEVVDVTGHLGGFNFQWAWSSGFAAGQYA